jgi:hypothetical protein
MDVLAEYIKLHEYEPKPDDEVIDLNDCIYKPKLKRLASVAEYDWKLFYELLNRGIFFLKEAKEVHDEMESYYVPYMDFNAVERLREETLDRILTFACEKR